MILTSFLVTLCFFLMLTIHRNNKLSRNLKHPALETSENVLSYLEACSYDKNNIEMTDLFTEFKTFVDQKKLSEISTINDWHHNISAKASSTELWNMFLTDLKRETEPNAKIDVIKHWMADIGMKFTYKEVELILNEFSEYEARTTVRKIYSESHKKVVK